MTGSTRGSLYVVATPIGHLSDLGVRAAEVLRTVDLVAAEDTRTTRVLLDHIGSPARTMSAHRHNERAAAERIIALLGSGSDVALVSDAGTPAVSDPGAQIVSAVRSAGFAVVPIPGPSAPIALVSASGLVEGPFLFEGFLPSRAKGRDARLAELARMPHAFVLFEAPHRIAQTLPAIAQACGGERRIAIGRELTKRFEEIHVCPAHEAVRWLNEDPNRLRGEYVLVVAAPGSAADPRSPEGGHDTAGGAPAAQTLATNIDVGSLLAELLTELPLSRAVRIAERVTGLPHRSLYQMALEATRARGAAQEPHEPDELHEPQEPRKP